MVKTSDFESENSGSSPGEAANDEWRALVTAVMDAHPGPWKQTDRYGDHGGHYTSIADANHNAVLDGETGFLSEPVFNLLLNFPELAEDFLAAQPHPRCP
jgi:hypothetical protein